MNYFSEAGNFRRDDEDFSDCISGTADATWDDFAKICTLTALPVIAKGVMNGLFMKAKENDL